MPLKIIREECIKDNKVYLTNKNTGEVIILTGVTDAKLTIDTGKNIIFLDIDGVLNGPNLLINCFYDIMYKLKLSNLAHRIVEIFGVHETKVRRLAKIVKATDAKVVMSSSWRRSYWSYKNHPSEFNKGFSDIVELDRLFNKYGIEVIDITGNDPNGRRGLEILQWLAEHESEINSFCIIDDEKFDIETLFADRLVYTGVGTNYKSGYYGLRHKHVLKAIDLLNNHPLLRTNPKRVSRWII